MVLTISELRDRLLASCLDRIASSIEHFQNSQTSDPVRGTREIGDCLSALGTGIELLLKSMLFNHDWRLIFTKPSTASETLLFSGDFSSVYYPRARKLLLDHGIATIPDSVDSCFHLLHDYRNKQTHFILVDSYLTIQPVVNDALAGVAHILASRNYPVRDEASDKNLISTDRVLEDISMMKGQYDHNLELAKKRATDASIDWKTLKFCPACRSPFLEIEGLLGQCHCYFCGYASTPEKAAEDCAANEMGDSALSFAMDGAAFPVYDCPSCGDSDVFTCCTNQSGNKVWLCFSCGKEYSMDEIGICSDCGEPFEIDERLRGVDEVPFVCPSCAEYRMHRE